MRKEIEKTVMETIDNPLLQTKWQDLIKKSGEASSSDKGSEKSSEKEKGSEKDSKKQQQLEKEENVKTLKKVKHIFTLVLTTQS